MDRLKTFLIYLIIFVAFFFFSNLLIFVGLNSNYDSISSSDTLPSNVQISQSEATLVNGRIRGTITNDGEEDINGKYMKVDLYSPRDVLLGTKYMEIKDLEQGAEDDFEVFFKAQDVDHYDISFVDSIENVKDVTENTTKSWRSLKDSVEFMDRGLSGGELWMLILVLALLG